MKMRRAARRIREILVPHQAEVGDAESDLHKRILALEAGLDRLVAEIHTTRALTIDAVSARLADLSPTSDDDTPLRAEFDRLDGFLTYHSDALARRLASLEESLAFTQMVPVQEGLDALLVAEVGDLVIPSHETGLLAFLARHGTEGYEAGVRSIMANMLRAGDNVVDVGANIGVLTLTALNRVTPGGRVMAFEPSPEIARTLQRTVVVNGYGAFCDVHPTAVGSTLGEMQLVVSDHSPYSHRARLDENPRQNTQVVPQTTLDDAIDSEMSVSLVKVDVEGDEAAVWRGGRELRGRNPNAAFILEWSHSNARAADQSLEELLEEITDEGYVVGSISHSGSLGPLPVEPALWEGLNVFVARGIAGVRRPHGFDELADLR